MGHLDIGFLSAVDRHSALSEVSLCLDLVPKNSIAAMSWPEYDYKPYVAFAIKYTSDCILLKFYVKEHSIRAAYIETNDPDYKDSCVELFIAFDYDQAYYNLEINCIGTCLLGYGVDKSNRCLLPELQCNKIRRQSNITTSQDGSAVNCNWELTLIIPFEVFSYHRFVTMKGRKDRVNFFKCGDNLTKPHFLSWRPITAPSPDFHLPQFFGKIHFV